MTTFEDYWKALVLHEPSTVLIGEYAICCSNCQTETCEEKIDHHANAIIIFHAGSWTPTT